MPWPLECMARRLRTNPGRQDTGRRWMPGGSRFVLAPRCFVPHPSRTARRHLATRTSLPLHPPRRGYILVLPGVFERHPWHVNLMVEQEAFPVLHIFLHMPFFASIEA